MQPTATMHSKSGPNRTTRRVPMRETRPTHEHRQHRNLAAGAVGQQSRPGAASRTVPAAGGDRHGRQRSRAGPGDTVRTGDQQPGGVGHARHYQSRDPDSGFRARHCHAGHRGRPGHAGVVLQPEPNAGHFHSAYRHQLHHSRPSRGICLAPTHWRGPDRRAGPGDGLCRSTDRAGRCPGDRRPRHAVGRRPPASGRLGTGAGNRIHAAADRTAAGSAPARRIHRAGLDGGGQEPADPPPRSPHRIVGTDASANRMSRPMNPEKRAEFFRRLQELDPEPTTELEYDSTFELLVAVILSAQATDVGVNKATRRLFPVANTPQAILDLGEDGLKDHIKTIGLFNSKARNVMRTCKALVEQYDGEVPRERDALEALPGVGRKTANVVMNTAFGEPTMAVDTHIFRVANRTGLAAGKTPLAVEKALLKRVPAEYLQHAHHWLILHGRYICKARTPDCPHCPVADLCNYTRKTPGNPDPATAAH